MKKLFIKLWNWVKVQDHKKYLGLLFNSTFRTIAWSLLGLWSYNKLLQYANEVSATLYWILLAESIALGLSGLALFAYTKVPFYKLLMEGEDHQMNSVERTAVLRLAGDIFKGVHTLVAIVVLGVYIVHFAK